ncbi:hypothetical protein [Shewanella atlantica]|uniref:Molecular chaperone n=1 Tax=Shewanella atlantica TaxID=271099 RepID=A0A431VWS4_9GAMM|nr:hypothetical protein [Shewanella atlantica]RTR27708.1 hypothetical protein EKG39_20115 [Shewanella atlantica]
MFNSLRWFTVFLFISNSCHAVTVSSMIEIADENGQAKYTVTNTGDSRVYLTAEISEIQVQNGEINTIKYTRDNLDIWKASVRPARTIIDPKFEKDIKVTFDCSDVESGCEKGVERVFSIAMVPTPYFEDEQPLHSVQVAIGFAPLLIILGTEEPINVDLNRTKETLNVYNHSAGYVNVSIDACAELIESTKNVSECKRNVRVLAGRNLPFVLPETFQKEDLKVTVKSFKGAFEQVYRLNY